MRKIGKSATTPASLKNAPTPTCSTEVLASIYKAEDVRTQLCEDQHSKCAYCECSLTKQYNDVEHYRPKSKYYWLGHDWNNLLYACPLCNRTFKKDCFPLVNEGNRLSAPGDLSAEEPLIINPANDDPAKHIKFNRHIAVGISDRGTYTIDFFHLNDLNKRPELLNAREQLYEEYKLVLSMKACAQAILQRFDQSPETMKENKELLEQTNLLIKKYQSPQQPYSGMFL